MSHPGLLEPVQAMVQSGIWQPHGSNPQPSTLLGATSGSRPTRRASAPTPGSFFTPRQADRRGRWLSSLLSSFQTKELSRTPQALLSQPRGAQQGGVVSCSRSWAAKANNPAAHGPAWVEGLVTRCSEPSEQGVGCHPQHPPRAQGISTRAGTFASVPRQRQPSPPAVLSCEKSPVVWGKSLTFLRGGEVLRVRHGGLQLAARPW